MATLSIKEKFTYEKIYFYLTVLLAFSIPLSRAGITFAILTISLIWIIEGKYRQKWSILKSIPFIKTAMLFFIYMTISLLWSQDNAAGLHILRLYSYWIIIPIIITSLDKKYIPYIINTFIVAMFISEILTYGVYFEFWSLKGATKDAPTIFMTHITYSILLAITVLLLLNRIFLSQSRKAVKILSFLFLLAVLGNLLISNGRSGLVALMVALVALAIIHYRHSIKTLLLIALMSISILLTAYFTVDNFNKRMNATVADITTISEKHYDSSIGIRLSFWLITKDIFLEDPIIGVGIGDSVIASSHEYHKNSYQFAPNVIEFGKDAHFHNIYLQTLAQLGIVGLLFILFIFYQILRLPIQNNEHKILSILFTIVYFIGSFFEPLWYKQTTIAIFILFVGLFIKMSLSKEVIEA